MTANALFAPAGPLTGALTAPPDKSISHRAALLAAFGDGRARISRFLDSADTRSTLGAVAALGAGVEIEATGDEAITISIDGFGLRGATPPPGAAAVDAGNAGTLIRLIAGLLAGQPAGTFVLDGDESIRTRPMGRIAGPLASMGASIATAEGGRPPLTIEGRDLRRFTTRCRSRRLRSNPACCSRACSRRAGPRSSSAPRPAITPSGCSQWPAPTSGSSVAGRACRQTRSGEPSASRRPSGSRCPT